MNWKFFQVFYMFFIFSLKINYVTGIKLGFLSKNVEESSCANKNLIVIMHIRNISV